MRIALLSVPGHDRWMGGVNYIKSIIYSLYSIRKDDSSKIEIYLILHTEKELEIYSDIFDFVEGYYIQDKDLPPFTLKNRIKWAIKRKISREINPRLIQFFKKKKITFIYSSILYKGSAGKIGCAKWLPDFQFKYFPEGCSNSDRKAFEEEFKFASENASTIVVSSNNVKEDFKKFYPNYSKTLFVYSFTVFIDKKNFAESPNIILSKYSIPKKYLMISNLFAPTKNHIKVFEAIRLLKDKGIEMKLVCTGNLFDYRNPGFINKIQNSISELGIYENVFILGSIPRFDQLQLFRIAKVIIQPSLFEGWNSSVEEAKMLNKTLILSDLPIHREQVKDNVFFFDPTSVESLSIVLEEVWNNKKIHYNEETEVEALKKYQLNIKESGFKFQSLIKITTG